mgnify:CR=1 FL=1
MRKQTSEELWGNRTLGDFLRIKNFNRIAIHLKFKIIIDKSTINF